MTDELIAFVAEAQRKGWPNNMRRRTDADFLGFIQTSFESGSWRYLDIWAGATTDVGLQTVFHDNKPYWGCAYRGGLVDVQFLQTRDNPVFGVLSRALSKPDRTPLGVRGPARHAEDGGWEYSFGSTGEISSFVAIERITLAGRSVYERVFLGGLQGDGVVYGTQQDVLASLLS